MVTNWTVAPAGPGSSLTVKTSWQGAGGIGGLFEKTFAPLGVTQDAARGAGEPRRSREPVSGPTSNTEGSKTWRPEFRGSRDTATSASGVLLRILRRHISAEPAGLFMLPSSQD
jgi:hypothetical protein